MIGKCNLCKEEKELQKVCHVIPEFFYRDSKMYHEHHNLVSLNFREFLEKGKKQVISNKQKIGEFDKYKLCPNCDGRVINDYESYTGEFFYAESLPSDKGLILNDRNGYIECLNADYKKLKLLFLSILWRASISERPLFSEIQLPLDIQEELRVMVLTGIPKKDTEFPVFVFNTFFDKTISNDFIFQPIKMKVSKENGYMFAFGGMLITFTIGINGLPNSLLKYRIKENGTFRSLKVPPGGTWKLINDWYNK